MTEPTDAEILALNAGEIHFSESPTKYPWAGHGTQYHAGAPGVLSFARAVLAKWGTPPAVAGEPVAWEAKVPGYIKYVTQSRYKKFSPLAKEGYKPYKCSNCTTPQPTQAQAGAVPMSHEAAKALVRKYGKDPLHLVLQVERHHGIKGGQHGTE